MSIFSQAVEKYPVIAKIVTPKVAAITGVTAIAVGIMAGGPPGGMPEHLKALAGKDASVIVSVNPSGIGEDFINSAIRFAITNVASNKKEFDIATTAYEEFFDGKIPGGSIAVYPNAAKTVLAVKDGSMDSDPTQFASVSASVDLGSEQLVGIGEDIFDAYMKQSVSGDELTDGDEEKIKEFQNKIKEFGKNKEDKEMLVKQIDAVDDYSKYLGRSFATSYDGKNAYKKLKESNLKTFKVDGSIITGKIDNEGVIEGTVMDNDSFVDFLNETDVTEHYAYMAYFSPKIFSATLNEMLPSDEKTLNDLARGIPSEFSAIKNNMENLVAFIKGIEWTGVVVETDPDNESGYLKATVAIKSTGTDGIENIKNTIELALATGVESFKKQMSNNLKYSGLPEDEIENIKSLKSKVAFDGDVVKITLEGKIDMKKMIEFMNKKTESKFSEKE